MTSMTLREFLKIHPDYRTVTNAPRQCARLVNDPETGGTVLEPVTITSDFTATLTRTTEEGFYVANVRTHSLGAQAPYFSITGEHWKSRRHWRNGYERTGLYGSGAMGETLMQVFPELEAFEPLHLADAITGEPRYAMENGWYFYSGKSHEHEISSPYSPMPTDTPHERAAKTLRVDPEDLPTDLDEDGFRAFVVAQRPRWQHEADEGRALILSLAAREEVPA